MTDVASPPAAAEARSDRSVQLRASGVLIVAMAVVGAVFGLVWEAWSPPGPAGAIVGSGIQADETEAFVAGDGRFLVITAIIGIIAAVVAWRVPRFKLARGPYIALALAIGGLLGAALTEWGGYLVRGSGSHFPCTAASRQCIDHLPLTVHMHGLLLVEAIAATLVYSLFVAFAAADDLGRPEHRVMTPSMHWQPSPATTYDPPVPAPSAAALPDSVEPESGLQPGWGYGHGPGAP